MTVMEDKPDRPVGLIGQYPDKEQWGRNAPIFLIMTCKNTKYLLYLSPD